MKVLCWYRKVSFVLILLVLMNFASNVMAKSQITITSQTLLECDSTHATFFIDIEWTLEDGDSIYASLKEPDGTVYSGLSSLNFEMSPSIDKPVGSTWLAPVAYPYTLTTAFLIKNNGETVATSTIELTCTGLDTGTFNVITTIDSSSNQMSNQMPEYPPDNRLNPTFGDGHLAILYPNPNEVAIDLYLYSSDNYISAFISEADLAPGFTRSIENIQVDVLENGRIQFTLGPDFEGKIYVFSFADLQGTDRRGTYFDPNE